MGIEYDKILKNPALFGQLSDIEFLRYEEDEDELWDAIRNSQIVLILGWDPDGFGHSGCATVYQWKSLYFSSSDYDPEGPFSTFADCLDENWFRPCPNPTLDSKVLSQKKLLELARQITSDEGDHVVVNDQRYVLFDGTFKASDVED